MIVGSGRRSRPKEVPFPLRRKTKPQSRLFLRENRCRGTRSASWITTGGKFQTAWKVSCGFAGPRRPAAITALPKRRKRCRPLVLGQKKVKSAVEPQATGRL